MSDYIGKRIVPKHCGEWDRAKAYEMLSIVLHTENGESYISRREVPAGTDILDGEYWAVCSRFSQQIRDMEIHLQETEGRMNTNLSETETRMAKDLHSTKSAMSEELTSTKSAMSAELNATDRKLTEIVGRADSDLNNGRVELADTAAKLNRRMDTLVKASTDRNANYASELVDARVDHMGTAHLSAGESIRSQITGIYDILQAELIAYPTPDRSDMINGAFSGSHFYVANNDTFSEDIYITAIHLISSVAADQAQVRLYTVNEANTITGDHGYVMFSGNAGEVLDAVPEIPILLKAGDRLMIHRNQSFGHEDSGLMLLYNRVGQSSVDPETGFVSGGTNTDGKVGEQVLNLGTFYSNASFWYDAVRFRLPFTTHEEAEPYLNELLDIRKDADGVIHPSAGESMRAGLTNAMNRLGIGYQEIQLADRSDMTKSTFSGGHFYVVNEEVAEKDLAVHRLYIISKNDVVEEVVRLYAVDAEGVVTREFGDVVFSGSAGEVMSVEITEKYILPAGNRLMLYHAKGFGTGNGITLGYQTERKYPISEATGFKTSSKADQIHVGDQLSFHPFTQNASFWFDAYLYGLPYAEKKPSEAVIQEVRDARMHSNGRVFGTLGESVRNLSEHMYFNETFVVDKELFQVGTGSAMAANLYGNETRYPQGRIVSLTFAASAEQAGEQSFYALSGSPETLVITDIQKITYETENIGEKEIITVSDLSVNVNEGDVVLFGASTTGTRIAYVSGKSKGVTLYGFLTNPAIAQKLQPGERFEINQRISNSSMCVYAAVEGYQSIDTEIFELKEKTNGFSEQQSALQSRMESLEEDLGVKAEEVQSQIDELYERAPNDVLYGKKIVAIGDSMTYGHNVTGSRNWLGKLAERNHMQYVNYGKNGCYMSYNVAGGTYPPEMSVVARFASMDDDADYILVFAGTNDAGNGSVDIGTESSKDNTTFMGAMNEICAGLQTKYPHGKIGFITPYKRTLRGKQVVEAIETVCANYGIPVFNNLKYGGINFSNAAQAEALTLGDNTHLNEAGMEFASYKYEAFVRSL